MWGETIYWERGGRLYSTNIGYKQVYTVYVAFTAIQQPPSLPTPGTKIGIIPVFLVDQSWLEQHTEESGPSRVCNDFKGVLLLLII